MNKSEYQSSLIVILLTLFVNFINYLVNPLSQIRELTTIVTLIPWLSVVILVYQFRKRSEVLEQLSILKFIFILLVSIGLSKAIFQLLLFNLIDPGLKDQIAYIKTDNMIRNFVEKSRTTGRNYNYNYDTIYSEIIESFSITKILVSFMMILPVDFILSLVFSFFLKKKSVN